jgi:methylene-tetrahydromethanopterin dehydrogenase
LPEKAFKEVFIFLDTDKHASAFDILTTIDIFPDASILKYEDVTAEDAEQIIHDAMFPRGPDGAKHTKVFINGRDFDRANEILRRIQKALFPPFEVAVVIDPRGAYTTASAAVAKTLELSLRKDLGGFEEKSVTILAGTGPVGQTAAWLYSSEKATVTITSRSLQRATSLAARINRELGSDLIKGVEAQTAEEVGKAIERAEIVLSAGAGGTQLLPATVLKESGKKCRTVVDINAIPPLGVEALASDADGAEILPNVFGIGALAVGKLKNKVEAELIKQAVIEQKGIFDYKKAYDIARRIIAQKQAEKRPSKSEPSKPWLP